MQPKCDLKMINLNKLMDFIYVNVAFSFRKFQNLFIYCDINKTLEFCLLRTKMSVVCVTNQGYDKTKTV